MRTPTTTVLGLLLAAAASATPPEITPIPDSEMFEDQLLDVDVEIINPDGNPLLTWTEVSDEAVHASFDEELNVIHVLPDEDWNGPVEITLGVDDLSDGSRVGDIEVFTVVVRPVNDCPTAVSAPPAAETLEDACWFLSRATLQEHVRDVDLEMEGDTLAVTFAGFALGTVAESDSGWSFCPDPEVSGSVWIDVTVDDGACTAASGFQLTVVAVDDCPELVAPLPTLFVAEDQSVILSPVLARFVDAEGQPLSFCGAEGETPGWTAVYDEGTDQLQLTPPPDHDEPSTVELCVSDGSCDATFPLSVLISPVNDSPRLPLIELLTAHEDQPARFAYPVVDPDGPGLTVSVVSSAPELAAAWSADSLTLTPAPEWSGVALLAIEACDGSTYINSCAGASVVVQVLAVNDPPVLAAIDDVAWAEDGDLQVAVAVTDVDSPLVQISAQADTSALAASWDAGARLLTLAPSADWHGEALVSVFADDGAGGADTTVFRAAVAPVNDCPALLAAFAADTTAEDGAFALEGVLDRFGDVDGDALELVCWTADVEGAGLSWSPEENRLTLAPPADWSGAIGVALCASDGACEAEGSWTLVVEPVNDDPVLAAIADQSWPEDTTRSVPLAFHDVDSDSLVVAAFADGEWLAVEWRAASGDLLLAPLPDANGAATVTVQVDDLFGRSVAERQFLATVTPVNDCPLQTADWEPGAADEDGAAGLAGVLAAFADADGDSLFVAAAWCDVDGAEAVWDAGADSLTVRPPADWSGAILATLVVGDGACEVAAQWSVAVGPVNDDPVLAEIADQWFEEDGQLELTLAFHDVDSDSLVVSVASGDEALALAYDPAPARLTLVPAPDWNGSATVTVTVDDLFGRAVAVREFLATVAPVDDAPWAEPAGDDWLCGEVEVDSFRGATVPGDTLRAVALPAPPEEFLAGDIVLHVEIGDAATTINADGSECSWTLGFVSVAERRAPAFGLRPAWPNPFNPTTQLAFTLPAAARARLTVHDLRGATVAVLADGELPAGEHRRVWQAGGRASGLYFAVLESEGRREVRRLTLLK